VVSIPANFLILTGILGLAPAQPNNFLSRPARHFFLAAFSAALVSRNRVAQPSCPV
jgi:hypothetical protein